MAVPIIVKLIMSAGRGARQLVEHERERARVGEGRTGPADEPQGDDVVDDELAEVDARLLEAAGSQEQGQDRARA